MNYVTWLKREQWIEHGYLEIWLIAQARLSLKILWELSKMLFKSNWQISNSYLWRTLSYKILSIKEITRFSLNRPLLFSKTWTSSQMSLVMLSQRSLVKMPRQLRRKPNALPRKRRSRLSLLHKLRVANLAPLLLRPQLQQTKRKKRKPKRRQKKKLLQPRRKQRNLHFLLQAAKFLLRKKKQNNNARRRKKNARSVRLSILTIRQSTSTNAY